MSTPGWTWTWTGGSMYTSRSLPLIPNLSGEPYCIWPACLWRPVLVGQLSWWSASRGRNNNNNDHLNHDLGSICFPSRKSLKLGDLRGLESLRILGTIVNKHFAWNSKVCLETIHQVTISFKPRFSFHLNFSLTKGRWERLGHMFVHVSVDTCLCFAVKVRERPCFGNRI